MKPFRDSHPVVPRCLSYLEMLLLLLYKYLGRKKNKMLKIYKINWTFNAVATMLPFKSQQ